MKYPLISILVVPLLLCSCASHKIRPAVNPDVATFVIPAKRASDTTTKAVASVKSAKGAAERAVIIVEKLVPSQGQEAQVAQLKLELKTTVNDLELTTAQLESVKIDLAATVEKSDQLQKQIDAQSASLYAAEQTAKAEKIRADKEHVERQRAAKQRDVFVWVISILGTIAVLLALKGILANVAQSFGAYAPIAAVVLWGAAIAVSMAAFYTACQIVLDLIVK